MNLRQLFQAATKAIQCGQPVNSVLTKAGWTKYRKGIKTYTWLSPCKQYVFKSSAREIDQPSEEELQRWPPLRRHYLRPLFKSKHLMIQPFAEPASEQDARDLRHDFKELCGRDFDCWPKNTGWFRGRLVIFDPYMG